MEAAVIFGQNLRAIRHRAGLSQEGMMRDSGIHRTVISKLERGEFGPNIETIVRLARYFDVPVGAFFGEVELEGVDVVVVEDRRANER